MIFPLHPELQTKDELVRKVRRRRSKLNNSLKSLLPYARIPLSSYILILLFSYVLMPLCSFALIYEDVCNYFKMYI